MSQRDLNARLRELTLFHGFIKPEHRHGLRYRFGADTLPVPSGMVILGRIEERIAIQWPIGIFQLELSSNRFQKSLHHFIIGHQRNRSLQQPDRMRTTGIGGRYEVRLNHELIRAFLTSSIGEHRIIVRHHGQHGSGLVVTPYALVLVNTANAGEKAIASIGAGDIGAVGSLIRDFLARDNLSLPGLPDRHTMGCQVGESGESG